MDQWELFCILNGEKGTGNCWGRMLLVPPTFGHGVNEYNGIYFSSFILVHNQYGDDNNSIIADNLHHKRII